jgi:hypothetical protein
MESELANGEMEAGIHEVLYNQKLSLGIYFYRLEAGKFTETKKMAVLK